jgi:hypothetical protein
MSEKHLKETAHHVGDKCWWYEEPGGICVVLQESDVNDNALRPNVAPIIRWTSIRAALKRKDRKP